jgi:hypothetical protein
MWNHRLILMINYERYLSLRRFWGSEELAEWWLSHRRQFCIALCFKIYVHDSLFLSLLKQNRERQNRNYDQNLNSVSMVAFSTRNDSFDQLCLNHFRCCSILDYGPNETAWKLIDPLKSKWRGMCFSVKATWLTAMLKVQWYQLNKNERFPGGIVEWSLRNDGDNSCDFFRKYICTSPCILTKWTIIRYIEIILNWITSPGQISLINRNMDLRDWSKNHLTTFKHLASRLLILIALPWGICYGIIGC